MLFAALGLGVASLVALGAFRLGISAWWILAPGAAAFALLALLSPAESSCEASEALEYTYGIAILVALASFTVTVLTAFVEAMRTGQGRRLLPIAAAVLLVIPGFFIVGEAIGNCLS